MILDKSEAIFQIVPTYSEVTPMKRHALALSSGHACRLSLAGWYRLRRVTVVSHNLTRQVSVWVPGGTDHNYDFDLHLELHCN